MRIDVTINLSGDGIDFLVSEPNGSEARVYIESDFNRRILLWIDRENAERLKTAIDKAVAKLPSEAIAPVCACCGAADLCDCEVSLAAQVTA